MILNIRIHLPDKELNAMLEQEGMTLEKFKEQLEKEMPGIIPADDLIPSATVSITFTE